MTELNNLPAATAALSLAERRDAHLQSARNLTARRHEAERTLLPSHPEIQDLNRQAANHESAARAIDAQIVADAAAELWRAAEGHLTTRDAELEKALALLADGIQRLRTVAKLGIEAIQAVPQTLNHTEFDIKSQQMFFHRAREGLIAMLEGKEEAGARAIRDRVVLERKQILWHRGNDTNHNPPHAA